MRAMRRLQMRTGLAHRGVLTAAALPPPPPLPRQRQHPVCLRRRQRQRLMPHNAVRPRLRHPLSLSLLRAPHSSQPMTASNGCYSAARSCKAHSTARLWMPATFWKRQLQLHRAAQTTHGEGRKSWTQ